MSSNALNLVETYILVWFLLEISLKPLTIDYPFVLFEFSQQIISFSLPQPKVCQSMQVLNMIVEDLFKGHPISQRKLKEILGHTPSQVLAGAVLGIVIACICCQGCLVAT